ncbi:phosphatase PAP2 family protein [Halopiger thermotolerans]
MSFGSGRGVGVTDALHGGAEWPVIVLFGLLTQLGDGWFLFLLGTTSYVADDELSRFGIDRRRGLFILALILVAVALIAGLKAYFQLPRPPHAGASESLALPLGLDVLFERVATPDGYGFPSGHALGSTVVWGGLALVLDRGSLRKRVGIAGAVVLLVSVSRLVLGVHYLVDVVVGIGVGVLVLGVLYRLTGKGAEPGRALLVAVGIGVAGLLVAVTFETVAALGGAVGAWAVWRAVADSTPAHPTTRRAVAAGALVLAAAAFLFVVTRALDPPLVLVFVGTAASAGGAVGAPLVGERFA